MSDAVADGVKSVGLGLAGLLAFGASIRKLLRTVGRTKVDHSADIAEIDLIDTLRNENRERAQRHSDELRIQRETHAAEVADLRGRADQAYKERNDAIVELGELRGELRAMRVHIEMLEATIVRMQTRWGVQADRGDHE